MTSFLFRLNEARRLCSSQKHKEALMVAASNLAGAIHRFSESHTEENMIALNGAWAHAANLLKSIPPEGAPAPLSGAPEATKFTTPLAA
jgi:hypothetical protein